MGKSPHSGEKSRFFPKHAPGSPERGRAAGDAEPLKDMGDRKREP